MLSTLATSGVSVAWNRQELPAKVSLSMCGLMTGLSPEMDKSVTGYGHLAPHPMQNIPYIISRGGTDTWPEPDPRVWGLPYSTSAVDLRCKPNSNKWNAILNSQIEANIYFNWCTKEVIQKILIYDNMTVWYWETVPKTCYRPYSDPGPTLW